MTSDSKRRHRRDEWRHPYKIGLTGVVGEAERELVRRLVRKLADEYSVGHIRTSLAGEGTPPHGGPEPRVQADGRALTRWGEPSHFDRGFGLLDCEVVIEELAGGEGGSFGAEALDLRRFLPDGERELVAAVEERLQHRAEEVPLYGLVLAGGNSTRMGRPKWALEYHGEPQAVSLHRLLEDHCSRAFVSLRPDQADEPGLAGLPVIPDRFLGMGPAGGILSAMTAHPDAAWLVLACDLPFVSAATLETLLAARRPLRFATSFVSPHDGMPEPLCAVYEPKARQRLFQVVALGHTCPRKLLMNASIELVESSRPHELTNANEPQEYERAVAHLRAGGER